MTNPNTSKIGIFSPYSPTRDITITRWRDETVQRYAEINPDFIYFFLEE